MGFFSRFWATFMMVDVMKHLFGSNESHYVTNNDSPYEPYLRQQDKWREEEELEEFEDMMMYEEDFPAGEDDLF